MTPAQSTLTARLNTAAADSRRGVLRLRPEAIAALGIREWDAVSLIGSRTTAAVADVDALLTELDGDTRSIDTSTRLVGCFQPTAGNGSTHRTPGNRLKSTSVEHSSAPLSMARAARWASLVRLPAAPSGVNNPRSTVA